MCFARAARFFKELAARAEPLFKVRAARSARLLIVHVARDGRLFFLIQPIKSLFLTLCDMFKEWIALSSE